MEAEMLKRFLSLLFGDQGPMIDPDG